MRFFMTEAGEQAWYAAQVRNVRMQITRFEIGAADVYTLSGYKSSGKTVQQFRTDNYEPDWQPDFSALRATDTVGYEGDITKIGYWRLSPNSGGLIVKVPHSAPDMEVGNVRIYAKNTGPYPYPTPGSPAYRRYEQVYDDDHGGEVLLCVGFVSVADQHWHSSDEFPHFTNIRLAINAMGMFNVIDRDGLAFEGVADVLQVETEDDLYEPAANGYGVAVIARHTRTGMPAVAYRAIGAKKWLAYPCNENFQATRETMPSLTNTILDTGGMDMGVVDPPAIEEQIYSGLVISSQPRKVIMNPLAFQQKDVSSYRVQTAPSTISILPNNGNSYTTIIKTADLAFLGVGQELFFMHNGTRYLIGARGKSYNTPPLVIRNGDQIWLDGTLQGPISSLSGVIYAELNEAPISGDANNTSTWLTATVSMHMTASIPVRPTKLDLGLTGRRIAGYTWDEYTPEQRITGLGYDLYGIPQTANLTIRISPSLAKVAGSAFGYGGGQMATDKPTSYLRETYVDPDGKSVIHRGITGLAGTSLHVYHNGVDVGVIATVGQPEGSVTINVKENDRIAIRAVLVGQAAIPAQLQKQVLAGISAVVEGVTPEGYQWLIGKFDLATTFGPDSIVPSQFVLPDLTPVTAITNVVGNTSVEVGQYLLQESKLIVPSNGSPYAAKGDWLVMLAAPNPTLPASAVSLTVLDLVVTGTLVNGVVVTLEKFSPYTVLTPLTLATNAVAATGLALATVNNTDAYRVVVTFKDPAVRVQAKVRITTDAGVRDLLIDSAVRSS